MAFLAKPFFWIMWQCDQGGCGFIFMFSKDLMGTGCWQFARQDFYSVVSRAGKLALSSLVSIILICTSHEAVLPVKGGVKEVSRPKSKPDGKPQTRQHKCPFSQEEKHSQAHVSYLSYFSWDVQQVLLEEVGTGSHLGSDYLCFRKFTRNGPL